MACTWFGEIRYCCSYTSLPEPALVVLITFCRPFFRALYSNLGDLKAHEVQTPENKVEREENQAFASEDRRTLFQCRVIASKLNDRGTPPVVITPFLSPAFTFS